MHMEAKQNFFNGFVIQHQYMFDSYPYYIYQESHGWVEIFRQKSAHKRKI